MKNHTPGPWIAWERDEDGPHWAVGPEIKGWPVAICMMRGVNEDEEANAELISKAWLLPYILENLLLIDSDEDCKLCDQASSFIKRAIWLLENKGEQNAIE